MFKMTVFKSLIHSAVLIACHFPLTPLLAADGTPPRSTPPLSAKTSPTEKSEPLLRILNQANLENLTRIPGIGPSRAATIQRYRPLRELDELLLLPGFGERTVTKILAHLSEAPAST